MNVSITVQLCGRSCLLPICAKVSTWKLSVIAEQLKNAYIISLAKINMCETWVTLAAFHL